LLIAVAAVGWMLWLGFRRGGTEVGFGFGLWGLGRMYTVLTPILLVTLIPLLGTGWDQPSLVAAWRLTGASPATVVRDRLANVLGGYCVFAAVVLACAGYAAARTAGAPGWLPTLVVVTVAGPLCGGYIAMALSYAAGIGSGVAALRIVVAVVLAGLDALNRLPWAALSLSGTSDAVRRAGGWTPPLRGDSVTGAVAGDAGFILSRLLLVVLATIAVVAVRGPARCRTIYVPRPRQRP
jgi:hypothetical protein